MTGSVARMAFLLASLDTRPWTRVPEPSLSSPFIARSDGGAVSTGMDPCPRLSFLAVALVLACGAAARADDDNANARAGERGRPDRQAPGDHSPRQTVHHRILWPPPAPR